MIECCQNKRWKRCTLPNQKCVLTIMMVMVIVVTSMIFVSIFDKSMWRSVEYDLDVEMDSLVQRSVDLEEKLRDEVDISNDCKDLIKKLDIIDGKYHVEIAEIKS